MILHTPNRGLKRFVILKISMYCKKYCRGIKRQSSMQICDSSQRLHLIYPSVLGYFAPLDNTTFVILLIIVLHGIDYVYRVVYRLCVMFVIA